MPVSAGQVTTSIDYFEGKVGIGTQTPVSQLHVTGDSSNSHIFLSGPGSEGVVSSNGSLFFNIDANNDQDNTTMFAIYKGRRNGVNAVLGKLFTVDETGKASAGSFSSVGSFNVVDAGGFNKVSMSFDGRGLLDTTAAAKLRLQNSGAGGDIYLDKPTFVRSALYLTADSSDSKTLNINNMGSYQSVEAVSTPLVLNAGGNNVGIGTISPSMFKLQVAGSIGPNAHNQSDLGSTSLRFKDLYLSGNVNAAKTVISQTLSLTPNQTVGAVPSVLLVSEGMLIDVDKSIIRIQTTSAIPVLVALKASAYADGQLLILKAKMSAGGIVLKDGSTSGIANAALLKLASPMVTLMNDSTLTLMYDALDSKWIEVARSINN